jgi:iron uptake system EfeUOB component EfeO/EfeM
MGELGRLGRVAAAAGLGAALLLLAGCGNDDGAGVRADGSASASGSGTGSGTGSGSGLAGRDLSGTTNDPQVQKAVADYRAWVVAEVDGLVADTARFTDAVRAGDLAEARRQFAPSRVRWERIEPIAGLVPEIDGKVDARVDDFEGADDPQFTGRKLFELLTPALQAKDAALVSGITAGFAAVDKSLAPYANADGTFDPYSALAAADKTRMQAELADLSEKLARIPGVLGLKA